MLKLIQGFHQFRQQDFCPLQGLYEQLSHGQKPETLFITCSDSRIDPNLLTRSRPGDLFILRNAGNIVPPHGAPDGGGEAATIEFAVSALDVKDIIVCGHTHCGAMISLHEPESLTGLPAVAAWLRHADKTREIVRDNYPRLDGEERVTTTIKENVLVQLGHLRTQPAVAARLAKRDLRLHGWVYKFETGEVFAYDPVAEQFVPIAQYQFAPEETLTRGRSYETL